MQLSTAWTSLLAALPAEGEQPEGRPNNGPLHGPQHGAPEHNTPHKHGGPLSGAVSTSASNGSSMSAIVSHDVWAADVNNIVFIVVQQNTSTVTITRLTGSIMAASTGNTTTTRCATSRNWCA